MHDAVYCLVSNETQANEILTHLRNLGLSSEISVMMRNQGNTKNMTLKENAVRGAETGGLVGGVLGALAGFSVLAIPGIGPFLVLGPIVSAMGGAAVGSAVGGLAGGTGALGRLGLPEDIEEHVQERLAAGDILLGVHTNDRLILESAARIFESSHAEAVYYSEDAAA